MFRPLSLFGTSSAGSGFESSPNTVGLWSFDNNTLADVGNDWTIAGTTPTYTADGDGVGGVGRGIRLISSTPNYVNVTQSGTDWTIEFWVNSTGTHAAYTTFQGNTGTNGTGDVAWYCQYDEGGSIFMFIFDINGDFPPGGHIILSNAPSAGSGWNHVTYSVQGNNVKCWINGGGAVSKTMSAAPRSFQSIQGGSTGPVSTHLDELRYSDAGLYNGASMTVPTPPLS